MRLVYIGTDRPVLIGDMVTLNGNLHEITHIPQPRSAASEGKLCVEPPGSNGSREFYVSVVGAQWIEREDRR